MADILYDFGTGRSDPETFPVKALQEAATTVLEREADALTHYPGGLGHAGLRRVMAARESEREGVPVDADNLVICNGSMQAVTLTAQALQEQKGDTVIVEAFSYPGTLSAYRGIGYELVVVDLDEGGMCMNHLEETLNRLQAEDRLPRFIYAISTYQNPTGFVMPKARRLEMIALARRYGVPIIEDNCYADVHYEGPVEPAIYALDDDPNHIYLCSLSKILAPGMRLGYILAKPPMLEKFLARRFDAGSNTFAAAVVAEFYRNGIGAHAEVSNKLLKEKRDLTLELLSTHLQDVCVWSHPPGGLFIWVRMPDDVDRKKLWDESQAAGVTYLPGAAFHWQNQNVPYLRLAFGHLTKQQISAGLPLLARCIQSSRSSNEPRQFEDLFSG